jgi:outer membrane protein OmpA-like peptidoglycan-associated protein
MMRGRHALLGVLLLLLAACGGLPDNVVVLVPDEDGSVGKAVVSGHGKSAELAGAYASVEANPGEAPGKVQVAKQAEVDKAFAGALAGTPRAPVVFRVFFANASAELDAKARATLIEAASAAKSAANADLSIIGHTDAIGNKDTQNIPLSLHRAEAVRDVLVAAGVSPDLIQLGYFGPNDPLVPNKPGVPEPLNRRVEVTIR